jgi:hypothetical protein
LGSQEGALHLADWCSPDFYADVIDWTVDKMEESPVPQSTLTMESLCKA